jgi:hypothetical protein
LVSTISFSGLERMDYSLAGNNVLKDHSHPLILCDSDRPKGIVI